VSGRDRGEGLRVSMEGITHRFGSVVALDDVSLDVRPGEFMTLLGPSGSGKTTLLRIVGGLVASITGRIAIGERDVTHLPAEKRGIGFVFQNYALFPHLDVGENVAFPLRLRKRPEAEVKRRVEETLDLVQMAPLVRRRASELSGGQQQRVALARAIVFHPDVLLMDEPLGALDKRLRQEVGLEVRRLQRELGITAIYVTHDQEEAFTMSDRIAVMNHGRIRQLATPSEIYRRPADEFTATFVGDLNRFSGEVVERVGGVATLRTAEGLRLRAAWPDASGPIRAATMGVRPEDVLVGATGQSDNRFDARVRTVIFLGSFVRTELVLPGGQVLVADLRGRMPPPEEGEMVTLGWSAADGLLFPTGPGDATPMPGTARTAPTWERIGA
jgi:putative spermidine/putrescine transport system ATP-binding protein